MNRLNDIDLIRAMDADALAALASRAIDRLLAPNPDWIERHQKFSLPNPPPSERDVETMLDGLEISVQTDEGTVAAPPDPREIASISRELGEQFDEIQDRLEEARQGNAQDFLDTLEESVKWSVRSHLVEHPDLEVYAWMETAESMDLAIEARSILMRAGTPEALGKWWSLARPLDEGWTRGFREFSELIQFDPRRALAWLDPLMDANLPEATPKPVYRHDTPKTTQGQRQERMTILWAELASKRHGRGWRDNPHTVKIMEHLESQGMADLTLLDWEEMLQADPSSADNTMAPASVIKDRLVSLGRSHPQAYGRWQEDPQRIKDPAFKKPDFARRATRWDNGRQQLDMHMIATALVEAGPQDFLEAMEAVDEVAQEIGAAGGYASEAALGASMELSWDAGGSSGHRMRL